MAEICDTTVNAGGALLEAYRAETDKGSGRRVRRGTGDEQVENLRRRTLLHRAVVAVAAAGTPVGLPALDLIRQGLAGSVTGRDVLDLEIEEWQEIAEGYGRAFLTEPPDVMLSNLAADIADLDSSLTHADEHAAKSLALFAAQLAAIMAMTLSNLGLFQPARRWWRVAHRAAAASGDSTIRVWVYGQDAIHALYDTRPLSAAVDAADRACALGGSTPSAGLAEALAARAQAMAKFGRPDEARNALEVLTETFIKLPDRVVDDQVSMYGWPEQRLWHSASYVLTELGETPGAYDAQARALALIPATYPRRRAKVQLHLARSLVREGHIDDGAVHAQRVIDALPVPDRSALIVGLGRRVLDHVPRNDRARSSVRGLREVLSLPAGPEAH